MTGWSAHLQGVVAGIIKQHGFGIAATLPKKYTNAVMAGQGVSGVIMVSFGLLTNFLIQGDAGTKILSRLVRHEHIHTDMGTQASQMHAHIQLHKEILGSILPRSPWLNS